MEWVPKRSLPPSFLLCAPKPHTRRTKTEGVANPPTSLAVEREIERENSKARERERKMGESSTGALVPAVKPDPKLSSGVAPEDPREAAEVDEGLSELDKDFLCPICMQMIKDAFLTACGHSFCYMCIITHLRNKNDCPCCAHYLNTNQLFPNFLLDKVRFHFQTLLFSCSLSVSISISFSLDLFVGGLRILNFRYQ